MEVVRTLQRQYSLQKPAKKDVEPLKLDYPFLEALKVGPMAAKRALKWLADKEQVEIAIPAKRGASAGILLVGERWMK